MRTNRLRSVFAAGGTAINAWVSTGDPYLSEVLSYAGFDSVTVDLQHGMFGLESAVRCLQAISAGPAVPLVRCQRNEPSHVGHLLDCGAYGVICPGVDTPGQARKFVQACRYPPTGRRSFGPSRGLLYGGNDYLTFSDSTVLALAMVESTSALEKLDAILAVEGLDGVYVGPSDLSIDAGWGPPGPEPSPKLLEAIRHVSERSANLGVVSGIFAATSELAAEFAQWGYQFVTPGNEVALLRTEATRRIEEIRAVGGTAST